MAYGAMITLALEVGNCALSPAVLVKGPMQVAVSGTASSHRSSCMERVSSSLEYQLPACEGARAICGIIYRLKKRYDVICNLFGNECYRTEEEV